MKLHVPVPDEDKNTKLLTSFYKIIFQPWVKRCFCSSVDTLYLGSFGRFYRYDDFLGIKRKELWPGYQTDNTDFM